MCLPKIVGFIDLSTVNTRPSKKFVCPTCNVAKPFLSYSYMDPSGICNTCVMDREEELHTQAFEKYWEEQNSQEEEWDRNSVMFD